MNRARAALLLLADGRLPAGGYAHSGGLEACIESGRICDLGDLEAFLRGRAATTGRVSAAFAAAACHAFAAGGVDDIATLDAELDARTPSPTLREISRTLGRQMLRAVTKMRPDPGLELLGRAPHQPLVLGAAATVFGATPHEAALAALHETVTGPATASVRLLQVDPFDVHAVLAGLTGLLDDLAAATNDDSLAAEELPAATSPLLDIAAEHHRDAEVRLFAS